MAKSVVRLQGHRIPAAALNAYVHSMIERANMVGPEMPAPCCSRGLYTRDQKEEECRATLELLQANFDCNLSQHGLPEDIKQELNDFMRAPLQQLSQQPTSKGDTTCVLHMNLRSKN